MAYVGSKKRYLTLPRVSLAYSYILNECIGIVVCHISKLKEYYLLILLQVLRYGVRCNLSKLV